MRNQKGSVTIITAMLVMLFIALFGLVSDSLLLRNDITKLRTIAEAASLAGAGTGEFTLTPVIGPGGTIEYIRSSAIRRTTAEAAAAAMIARYVSAGAVPAVAITQITYENIDSARLPTENNGTYFMVRITGTRQALLGGSHPISVMAESKLTLAGMP
jgi:hypothetical protein